MGTIVCGYGPKPFGPELKPPYLRGTDWPIRKKPFHSQLTIQRIGNPSDRRVTADLPFFLAKPVFRMGQSVQRGGTWSGQESLTAFPDRTRLFVYNN